ncbi:MAG: NTP transferase domain-containing protein [Chloroflexi bacterium]|nr:NTP transferase domain-containing protein [Chloroflexota bacterium]
MIEHAIIMAASPSRSMEALTRTRPKAMLPILGRPMIARIMDGYYQAGIRRFTVVVGEDEGGVAVWLHEKWHPDAQLNFLPRGHKRGTAAALFACRSVIDGPFVITSCDAIVPDEHIRRVLHYFDNHPEDAGVLSLHPAPDEIAEVGGVLLDPRGYVIFASEQPSGGHQGYITALPIFAFTPAVLGYLDQLPVAVESGGRALSSLIQMMVDDNQLVGSMEAPEPVRLQTAEDLLAANIAALGSLPMAAMLSDVPTSAEIIDPVYIDAGVTVRENVTLGPNVYLESGSEIGANARVSNAIVLGVRVGIGQKIDQQVIKDDRL